MVGARAWRWARSARPAAVRRARVGFVDNELLPLDTPMGSLSTGPVLAAVAGLDLLLLGLPTVVRSPRATR